MLARGDLTEGHARAVLALPDDDARRRLAKRIANEGMTVRAAEKAARDGGARRHRTTTAVDPALAERARTASQRLTGLPARVSGGKLELHFGDDTGLAELVEVLEGLLLGASRRASQASVCGEQHGRSWIRTRDLRLVRTVVRALDEARSRST